MYLIDETIKKRNPKAPLLSPILTVAIAIHPMHGRA